MKFYVKLILLVVNNNKRIGTMPCICSLFSWAIATTSTSSATVSINFLVVSVTKHELLMNGVIYV